MFAILDQRKQRKTQWLQDPNQRNVGKLKRVRHEASTNFRNKTKDSLKAKINEQETNSKKKNVGDLYRGVCYIRKG